MSFAVSIYTQPPHTQKGTPVTDKPTLPPPVPATEQALDAAYNEGYSDARASNIAIGISFALLSLVCLVLALAHFDQATQINDLNREAEDISHDLEVAEGDLLYQYIVLVNLNKRLEELELRFDPVSRCPYEELAKASTPIEECEKHKESSPNRTVSEEPKPGEWTGQP